MKVLFLPRTGPVGPSSRYRVYQLLPLLDGIEAEVSPAPSHSPRAIWQCRRADLNRLGDFDAVFVQKGIFPGLYSGFERRLAAAKPLVFDFDDAMWLPRRGGSLLARALHRERAMQEVLCCAAAVIAGNDFLAEYARRLNRNVTIVPTAIDTTRYLAASGTTVGWIGSRTTLPYLRFLQPVFEKLGILPRVIAAGDPGFRVDFRPWQLETELAELTQIGIGVAPLPDGPWERGKCGVKLLQYMACGMAVVASPVGVQSQILQHGENGLLARTEADWLESLTALRNDANLRVRLGAAARQTVENFYDIRQASEKVVGVLRSLR